MSTLNWQDVVAMFPEYVSKKPIRKATKKGAVHNHRPTWKSPKSALTPAQWHKAMRKAATA